VIICKEDDPAAVVKKFINQFNLPQSEETTQSLYDGIARIQQEWQ
jgi:hypothetical protein